MINFSYIIFNFSINYYNYRLQITVKMEVDFYLLKNKQYIVYNKIIHNHFDVFTFNITYLPQSILEISNKKLHAYKNAFSYLNFYHFQCNKIIIIQTM